MPSNFTRRKPDPLELPLDDSPFHQSVVSPTYCDRQCHSGVRRPTTNEINTPTHCPPHLNFLHWKTRTAEFPLGNSSFHQSIVSQIDCGNQSSGNGHKQSKQPIKLTLNVREFAHEFITCTPNSLPRTLQSQMGE